MRREAEYFLRALVLATILFAKPACKVDSDSINPTNKVDCSVLTGDDYLKAAIKGDCQCPSRIEKWWNRPPEGACEGKYDEHGDFNPGWY